MTPLQIAVFALACLLIGLSKGGLGGPLPVVLLTPLLAAFFSPTVALSLPIPFLIFADWFALKIYWGKWNRQQIGLLMPAGIVGAVLGGLLLAQISLFWLKVMIGVFAGIVLIYKLLEGQVASIQYQHRNWHAYLSGGLAAFGSVLANAGAPPYTIYLMLQKLDAITFIGTTTLFFTVVNLMKVPVFVQLGYLQLDEILAVWWAFPIVPLGVWLGRKALAIIEQKAFERIMLGLILLSIVMLFASLR